MKQTHIMILAIALVMLQFGLNNAIAGKEIYDDFSSNYIDGSKWRQRTYVREIVNGQYVSKLGNRTPGMSAEISSGFFTNHLPFADPDSVNSIECEITIVEAKLDSATDSESFARIAGYFYNINETGGATGDIFAYIAIGDRGKGGLEAFWKVFEVLTDDTDAKKVIETRTIIAPGSLKYNTPYKVKISYDGDRSFSFIVNELTNNYTGPIRKRPAVTSLKSLSTAIDATNGSNNGFVFAKFDDVNINDPKTLYDNFSLSPIDLSKWRWPEYVREVSNGSLRINIQSVDVRRHVSTYLIRSEYDAPYLEAKVRINSDSLLSTGAWGIARIQGYYYNDSRGPGSGKEYNRYEGDVFAGVRLQLEDNGDREANAWISRSNDANETTFTSLFSKSFSTPINLDTDYVLSIKYTGSQLIFKCNDETLPPYTIETSKYIPFGEHRALRTRIYLDPGESEFGYMKAQFDDVYIEKKGKTMPWIPLLLLDN